MTRVGRTLPVERARGVSAFGNSSSRFEKISKADTQDRMVNGSCVPVADVQASVRIPQ